MRKKFSFVLILVVLTLLFGCANDRGDKVTVKWIEKHEKPITVEGNWYNKISGKNEYTLICKNGHMLATPKTNLQLPDTLR